MLEGPETPNPKIRSEYGGVLESNFIPETMSHDTARAPPGFLSGGGGGGRDEKP